MAGYWPRSAFACLSVDQDGVEVDKYAKNKELGQYPVILTSCLANNPYLWFKKMREMNSNQTLPALWLATRADEMPLSSVPARDCVSPEKMSLKGI